MPEAAKTEIRRVNPVLVQKHLEGVLYPASRDDLIRHARSRNADRDILAALKDLPERGYRSPIDVSRHLGKTASREGGAGPRAARGLQAAPEETRQRVARAGGAAPHEVRGLQAASEETRQRVARAGGEAPHGVRGLQAASEGTRQRVARAGGGAPHGERGLQAASEETRKRVATKGGETSAAGKKAY